MLRTAARHGCRWLLLCLLGSQPLFAGSFTISPVRVELSAAHPIATLTLHNPLKERTLVEAQVLRWSQVEGADRFRATRALLVTPPVFELAGHGEQIVRVALRRAPDPMRELSYRVFLEEVPPPLPAGATGIGVTLRVSLPVFVDAAHATRPAVLWRAQPLADGRWQIDAHNQGSAHLQIAALELTARGAAVRLGGMKYLLPGSTASWITPKPLEVPPGAALEIHGESDRGEFTAQAARAGP